MSNTKKKLPTGPIRMEIPTSKTSETREAETTIPESGLLENTKQDYEKQDFIPEPEALQTDLQESQVMASLTDIKQDSGKQDYKKVAMRLSADSLERLRQLRVETELPYEILVDVMIRNWDKLPQRTQSAYLKEAKTIRGERLIAGQIKTLQAIQTKHLTR
jgi:hypothetical protein